MFPPEWASPTALAGGRGLVSTGTVDVPPLCVRCTESRGQLEGRSLQAQVWRQSCQTGLIHGLKFVQSTPA